MEVLPKASAVASKHVPREQKHFLRVLAEVMAKMACQGQKLFRVFVLPDCGEKCSSLPVSVMENMEVGAAVDVVGGDS